MVKEEVKKSGVKSGLCLIYVPHTTCAVFINEGADPDVIRDIFLCFGKADPLE
jgi:secondary thiamine-phosphate synthase enzyme